MISEYDIKKYAEKHPDCWYSVDENNNVIDKSDGHTVCTLKSFTQLYREAAHCDFESVYYCHGTLQNTIRCRECGTVIFATDDVWGYDPNLCCPTCGGYETSLEYWTAEEIAGDEKKKNTIAVLEQMQQEQIEADKRYVQRGNKYDWQIWKGRLKIGKRYALSFDLECENFPKTRLKGLRLIVHIGVRDDGFGYALKKHWRIPLSISEVRTLLRIRRLKRKGELA